MLDFSHLANARNGSEVQTFNALGAGDWQTWLKPRGKSNVTIIGMGSGGGGGNGFAGAAATARGGGGGGGSGGLMRLIIPADLLPDVLYINVGIGGAVGGNGFLTAVSIRPDSLNQSRVLVAFGGSAGGSGTNAAAGAAGAAGVSANTHVTGFWGINYPTLGNTGAAGGAQTGAVGSPITWGSATPPNSGGAGGGGTTSADFAGGGIVAAGFFPSISGGAAGTFNGADGFESKIPLAFCGGAGGGASNLAAGGNGGKGAIGSGGGGGGGGVTAGVGGPGGGGLVIIQAW